MDCSKTFKCGGEVSFRCPPNDSLVEILSRLHAKPLFRFMCVSKTWCGLIAGRLRCRKFPQTLQGFFSGRRGEGYRHLIDVLGRPGSLVDPSFSFLTKMPEIKTIVFLGSCNGLLFGHMQFSYWYESLGYIVCNPATEQWVAVPSSGWTPWEISANQDDVPEFGIDTFLVFYPTASPHFQLVQLWMSVVGYLAEVHTFSSETGVWRRLEGGWLQDGPWIEWGIDAKIKAFVVCPFNGMLHEYPLHP